MFVAFVTGDFLVRSLMLMTVPLFTAHAMIPAFSDAMMASSVIAR